MAYLVGTVLPCIATAMYTVTGSATDKATDNRLLYRCFSVTVDVLICGSEVSHLRSVWAIMANIKYACQIRRVDLMLSSPTFSRPVCDLCDLCVTCDLRPCSKSGGVGAGTQLFKLVETDLMSKELTRYGPTDAEHLGLHSVQDVLANIAAATSALPEAVVAVAGEASAKDAEAAASSPLTSAAVAPPAVREEDVLAAWGLGPRVSDSRVEEAAQVVVGKGEETSIEEGLEKMAIKRTYQPSTIKRKRKHGFLYRAKTRLGKKILQRRQEKGRWRLGI